MQHIPETVSPDPHAEYRKRLEARRALVAAHEGRHILLGNLRLAVVLAAAALAWLSFAEGLLTPWWLIAPLAVFTALAVVHDRVLQARRQAARAVTFYERGQARLEDRWMGAGEAGERFLDNAHPYSRDLDLFGTGGLFELISTARTRAGEETLARWLLHPAPIETIRARHAAIDELRSRLDLREDLALLGDEVRTGREAEPLPRWGESPPILACGWMRWLVLGLAFLAVSSFTAWVGFGFPRRLFLFVLVVEALVGIILRRRVLKVVQAVQHPAHDLALLAEVLVRLERERFTSPRLAAVRAMLDTEGHPPSWHIARLNRLTELLDSRDNVAVRLIGPPLFYTTQLAFAIESWRKHSGPAVRRWLEAVGEIGALSALACYAYEHPGDPFPEFVEGPALLEAEALGHPLIPAARLVRNDLSLGTGLPMLAVSGSNMSGKSTLLRTLGVNVVLAMTGAPVRARRLRLSPLAVGASIRVLDSLQTGSSRFYAEITRLRQLLDITKGPLPLFFLLDELLHGTNSHDRRLGAEAVVRSLVSRGAIGLITTHDLALTHIPDALQPPGANVHFEDHFEDGRVTFDYLLRPGVVRKSNALDLMRSVGLEV